MQVVLEGAHCRLTLAWPAPAVVLISFTGTDINEFGATPFRELEKRLVPETELYIDASQAVAASIDVSGDWARWLGRHKASFAHVSMLTGSRFIQISADLVKRFAKMGDLMRLYTDADAFDEAFDASLSERGR